MTLSPPVRSAVLEVVRRLRDPMLEVHVDNVGRMVLDAMPAMRPHSRHAVLDALRSALGLPSELGSLARWARGKSREEVAEALERIATSEEEERESGMPHVRREEHMIGSMEWWRDQCKDAMRTVESQDAEIARLRAALKGLLDAYPRATASEEEANARCAALKALEDA